MNTVLGMDRFNFCFKNSSNLWSGLIDLKTYQIIETEFVSVDWLGQIVKQLFQQIDLWSTQNVWKSVTTGIYGDATLLFRTSGGNLNINQSQSGKNIESSVWQLSLPKATKPMERKGVVKKDFWKKPSKQILLCTILQWSDICRWWWKCVNFSRNCVPNRKHCRCSPWRHTSTHTHTRWRCEVVKPSKHRVSHTRTHLRL